MSHWRLPSLTENATQNLGDWSLPEPSSPGNPDLDLGRFLNGSGISTANHDATLSKWANPVRTDIAESLLLGVQGLTYCMSEAQRTYLDDERRWFFSGDSRDPNCL